MDFSFTRNIKSSIRNYLLIASSAFVALFAHAADYPENRDYGDKGDFVTKRGVEFGRTANLLPIGPILINFA